MTHRVCLFTLPAHVYFEVSEVAKKPGEKKIGRERKNRKGEKNQIREKKKKSNERERKLKVLT